MTLKSHFDKAFGIALSGRYFAHNHLARPQRAFLAADLANGKVRLCEPTLVQAAWICRVDRTAAWWASNRQDERAAIIAGLLPLVPPRASVPASRSVSDTERATRTVATDGAANGVNIGRHAEARMRERSRSRAAGIAVFPCGPDKKPLVKCRKFSSSDTDAVLQIWSKHPNALPAIDLGKSDLIALDGDRHGDGPDGRTALRNLLQWRARLFHAEWS
jgi:hypothetical protein